MTRPRLLVKLVAIWETLSNSSQVVIVCCCNIKTGDHDFVLKVMLEAPVFSSVCVWVNETFGKYCSRIT